MMGVKYFCRTLFKLRSRTGHIRNVNFIELGIQVLLLLIFYRHGLVAVALTQTAAVACSLAIYAFMLRRKRQEDNINSRTPRGPAVVYGWISYISSLLVASWSVSF